MGGFDNQLYQNYFLFKKINSKNLETLDVNDFGEYPDIICDICSDISGLENKYDKIICIAVLEHVYDDELAIKELHRVLKKKGIAILQVPLNLEISETIDGRDIKDGKKRNELFGQYDHLRIYGKDFFKNKI